MKKTISNIFSSRQTQYVNAQDVARETMTKLKAHEELYEKKATDIEELATKIARKAADYKRTNRLALYNVAKARYAETQRRLVAIRKYGLSVFMMRSQIERRWDMVPAYTAMQEAMNTMQNILPTDINDQFAKMLEDVEKFTDMSTDIQSDMAELGEVLNNANGINTATFDEDIDREFSEMVAIQDSSSNNNATTTTPASTTQLNTNAPLSRLMFPVVPNSPLAVATSSSVSPISTTNSTSTVAETSSASATSGPQLVIPSPSKKNESGDLLSDLIV